MATRKLNPRRMKGSWSGSIGSRKFVVQFSGYMSGTFLEAAYAEDAVTEHVGSDGDVTLVLNANRLANLTCTLAMGAAINDALSKLVPNADLNYLPVGQMNWEDLNGTMKIKAPEAWIKKTAPITVGNEVTGRAWVFGMANAEINVGAAGDF
jgi:hypothetical protein